MHTTPGVLAVRTVHGRNGAFNVATLTIDLGEFVVKDKRLEQFDEGRYEGTFTVSKIGPYCYPSRGRLVTELRATLFDLQLTVQGPPADDPDIEVAEPEDDEEPVETPAPAVPAPSSEPESEPPPEPDTKPEPGGTDDDADAELFGACWPAIRDAGAGDRVKLDTTVPRGRLAQQAARLGKKGLKGLPGLGWTLDLKTQEWIKP